MAMTPAQRAANQRYDREHNTVISVKATKEHAQQFREACKRNGTTANKVLHDCMIAYINDNANGGAPRPE